MSLSIIGLLFLTAIVQSSGASQKPKEPPAATTTATTAQQEVISLSKEKWRWMSERNLDALSALFHEDAVFVHMGGTMSRSQELEVIKSGGIHYKQADIQEVSVKIIGTTAILLNRIRLVAVVGGNEVTNPFVVTEVYVRRAVPGSWAHSRSPGSSDNSDARTARGVHMFMHAWKTPGVSSYATIYVDTSRASGPQVQKLSVIEV